MGSQSICIDIAYRNKRGRVDFNGDSTVKKAFLAPSFEPATFVLQLCFPYKIWQPRLHPIQIASTPETTLLRSSASIMKHSLYFSRVLYPF